MGTASTNTVSIKLGDCIGGCRIEKFLGQGGMGSVYEARQVSLDRKVAVKVLKKAVGPLTARSEWLIQEARLAAKLNHPNIVQIYDVGQQKGIHFMVMEFVEGVTLQDLIPKKPTFPLDRLLRVSVKATRGLSAAHKEEIVHRDIKPENILLTSKGEVKIADFGAASLFFTQENLEGNLLCTPAYAAPEVILREPSDGKADVYALGLILYTAVTGRHPLLASNVQETLEAQVNKIPQPLRRLRPGIAQGFAGLIENLCAKKPRDRPSSEKLLGILESHPEWGMEVTSFKNVAKRDGSTGVRQESVHSEVPRGSSLLNAPLLKERRRKGEEVTPEVPSKFNRKIEPRAIPGPPELREEKNDAPPLQDEQGGEKCDDPLVGELCVKGRFHLMKKNWTEAGALFQRALDIDPDHQMALLGIAQALTQGEKYREATAFLAKAISLGKTEPWVILNYLHFQPLRNCKEFRRLLAEYSI